METTTARRVPRGRGPDGAEARPARRRTSSESSADSTRRRRPGPDLVVFPECALSGYGFASREEGLAHAVDGRLRRRCGRWSRPARDMGASAFSECWNATAIACSTPRAGRPGRAGRHLSQGSSAIPGHRHVRRPRRPAVRRSRRGRAQGRHAHLLRRRLSGAGPRADACSAPIFWSCRPTGRPTRNARPST